MKKIEGRAVTVEEKFKIMDRLLAVWLKYPDLRLGQLIFSKLVYDLPSEEDVFYVEDERLMELMEKEDGQ